MGKPSHHRGLHSECDQCRRRIFLRSTQHPLPSGFDSSSTAQEVTGVDFEEPNFGADIPPVSETTDPTGRGVRPSAVDADAAQKLTRLSETLTGTRIGD
jgi:hypothetical protein